MATTRIRIGPADHGRRMTLDEFREAEEGPGSCYELARGVLEVTEVPRDGHAQVVDNLHEAISSHRRLHPGPIRRIGHGSDVRLIVTEVGSDRHPDLAVVFRDAPVNERGRLMPALVVEVVSPGSSARHRDYVEKREEYLGLGIPEYWIVDPQRRLVTVLVRRDDPQAPIWTERVFQGDEVIASPLLPGFGATVAELWADADPEDEEA